VVSELEVPAIELVVPVVDLEDSVVLIVEEVVLVAEPVFSTIELVDFVELELAGEVDGGIVLKLTAAPQFARELISEQQPTLVQ
jgi:hypothetical protein